MQSNSDELICQHCYQQFKLQRHYDNHVCDNMRKEQIIQTPTGQAAHDLYNEWLIAQKRPTIDRVMFTRTKLFATFVRFVLFARKCNYPMLSTFVTWAHRRGYLPVVWQRNSIFVEYLEYIDHNNYRKQLNASVRHIQRMCDEHECDIEDFFDEVDSIEIVRAIQLRKVFPMFLLATNGFAKFLGSLNTMNRAQVESIARVDRLQTAIVSDPDMWNEAKHLAEAMGL